MKKIIVSFLIAFSFLFQTALAADFSVNTDKTTDYPFYATRTDYINVTIGNLGQTGLFQASVIGMPSEWITVPLEASTVNIPSMGTETVSMQVQPSKSAIPGIYKYFLKVTRLSSMESIEKELLVNIIQTTNAIISDSKLSCASCTRNVTVSGEVVNVGSKNLDLMVIISFGQTQKTIEIGTVEVGDDKEFSQEIDLSGTLPGSHGIDLSLLDSNGTMKYNETLPFIIPTVEDLVTDSSVSMTPFGSSVTLTAINMGNVVQEADLQAVSGSNWYTVLSGPSPSGVSADRQYWSVTVEPGQSVNISYAEIYWPTYIIIIAAAMAFLFVYTQSSAFTFSKKVMGSSSFKPGKDMSVSLHIRSKRKGLERVAVRDLVPPNFSIVSKFDTVKPVIKKVANGIELVWKLGGMGPNEERVLHYTIRPSEDAAGRTSLPSAVAKSMDTKGVTVRYSNRIPLISQGSVAKPVSVKVSK